MKQSQSSLTPTPTLTAVEKLIVEQLEEDLRFGRLKLVHTKILKLDRSNLRRPFAAAVAPIARRAKVPSLALRLLMPFVKKDSGFAWENDLEKTEYAAALYWLGAHQEAQSLLMNVDQREYPEASLYLGISLLRSWDYKNAEKYFRCFCENPQVPRFRWLVGQLNIAACAISLEQWAYALETLYMIENEARRSQFAMVLNHSLELLAQAYVLSRDETSAEIALQNYYEHLVNGDQSKRLYYKWLGMLRCRQGRNDGLEFLNQALILAKEAKDFENVRDCSLQLGIFREDRTQILRVIFGSSSEKFRKKALQDAGLSFDDLPTSFIWGETSQSQIQSQPQSESALVFDWVRLKPERRRLSLFGSDVLDRYWDVLNQDLFRPIRTGALWEVVYPKQHYNLVTSPVCVFNNLSRLRRILKSHAPGVRILSTQTGYLLSLEDGWHLKRSLQFKHLATKEDDIVGEIRSHFVENEFSSAEAQKVLRLSQASVSRHFRELENEKKIVKIRNGRSIKYKLIA